MFSHLLRALRNEAKDKSTRSAGKEAAGAALLADGLLGLENPLDGKSTRVGIVGALVGMVVGVVLIIVGFVVGSAVGAGDGDVVVSGTVIDYNTRRGSESTTYAPVVEYTDPATGLQYTASSNLSTSSRPVIGSARDVAFAPDSPASGKVLSGASKWLKWGLVGVGVLAFLGSAATFVIRAVSIVGGIKLMLDGRRERRDGGDDRGVMATLTDGALDVVDEIADAKRIDSRATGNESKTATASAHAPGPPTVPQPSPTLPPAGWYPDPSGDDRLRWFDGTKWTAHTQVRPAA